MIMHNKQQRYIGRDLIDKLINKVSVELHILGYHYFGPGTKLAQRFEPREPRISVVYRACRELDIAYLHNQETHKTMLIRFWLQKPGRECEQQTRESTKKQLLPPWQAP